MKTKRFTRWKIRRNQYCVQVETEANQIGIGIRNAGRNGLMSKIVTIRPLVTVSGDGDGDGLIFSALVHSLRANVWNQYDDQNSQHPSDLDSYPSGLTITGILAIPVRSGRLRT